MMNDCIFCGIMARQAPGYILDEDDQTSTFLSLDGHPMVVPKKHIVDIYSLDDRTGQAIMGQLIKMARVVKRGLACDGVYITQANEAAAGQDVFHLHFHVYPRWHALPQQTQRVAEEERIVIYRRLQDALGES